MAEWITQRDVQEETFLNILDSVKNFLSKYFASHWLQILNYFNISRFFPVYFVQHFYCSFLGGVQSLIGGVQSLICGHTSVYPHSRKYYSTINFLY